MPAREFTANEVKALILNFLSNRRRWGARYYNRQRLERYLAIGVLGDGKRVSRCLDELISEGAILASKKGATVSLNTRRRGDILALIDTFLTP